MVFYSKARFPTYSFSYLYQRAEQSFLLFATETATDQLFLSQVIHNSSCRGTAEYC